MHKSSQTRIFLFLMLFLITVLTAAAPFTSHVPDEPPPKEKLAVFFQGDATLLPWFQEGIGFVEFVNDEEIARVTVRVKSNRAEQGGTEYQLMFSGRGDLSGLQDTFTSLSPGTEGKEDGRKELVHAMQLGLVNFAARTPAASRITAALSETVNPTSVKDPWNFWVFNLSGSGYFNGEESYKSSSIYGSFSANRVTPELKLKLSVSGSYSKDRYIIDDTVIESPQQSYSFNGMAVKSLGEHWSIGGYLGCNSSTYSNNRISIQPAPAVEYNFFPYSESTRRQFTLLYRLRFTHIRYREETIYDKTRENLWSQSLSASLDLKYKWGTISTSISGSHYFHDFKKNEVSIFNYIDLRLTKGLSFFVVASIDFIHDQLFLPKGEASIEEVLLRRIQQATTYSYFASVGLNFRFGSICSNIVNPRFGSTSAGGMNVTVF